MVAKLKAFWASLPHQWQAVIAAFGSAAFVTVLKNSAAGDHILLCQDWHCVREHISTFMSSGATAVLTFYMRPNTQQPPQPPAA